MVLARLLAPEAFGIVGLVAVFLAGLNMFSELGLVASIVQHPRGDEPRFLGTAFTLQAIRGVSIWLLAIIVAYPMALFYRQPELFPLLVVAGSAEAIRGLTSTSIWWLTRHVKLRDITILSIGSELVAAVLAISWAYFSPTAWTLVARTIASAAVYAVGSHLLAKPRVRFQFDSNATKDILHFGGWISIATAAHFLGGQGERLILGKFITAAELGCFSLALMISSVPAGGISQLVNQIFLPMISTSVRNDRAQAILDYRRARRAFFGIAVLTGVALLVFGRLAVSLLLPAKYAMTGWMLQILGLRVALDFYAAPASSLMLAFGRSKYSAVANASRLVFMTAGIWMCFSFFGLRQALLALVLAQALSFLPLISGVRTLLPEVGRTELAWYGTLLATVGLTAALVLART